MDRNRGTSDRRDSHGDAEDPAADGGSSESAPASSPATERDERLALKRTPDRAKDAKAVQSDDKRNPWITRLGIMATAMTVVVGFAAVLSYIFPRQDQPDFAPPLAPREGSVKVETLGVTSFYPRGGVLPEVDPPDYPHSEQDGHCHRWVQWASNVGAAPETGSLDIIATANVTSPITISDFSVRILDKRPMEDGARIKCLYGAGGLVGTSLLLNLDNIGRRTPMDIDGDGAADTTLPGGSFIVEPSRTETLTVAMSGTTNYTYSLIITLTISENGAVRTAQFGTEQRPLRIALPDAWNKNVTYYDWNVELEGWFPTY